jgi:hypothetical protein
VLRHSKIGEFLSLYKQQLGLRTAAYFLIPEAVAHYRAKIGESRKNPGLRHFENDSSATIIYNSDQFYL